MSELTTFFFVLGILVVLWWWLKNRFDSSLPIDNKRRAFSNDEKIKVTEKIVLKYGRAKCTKCGSSKHLHVDHITPLNRGGHNGLDNLQLLCERCNTRKGDRYIG